MEWIVALKDKNTNLRRMMYLHIAVHNSCQELKTTYMPIGKEMNKWDVCEYTMEHS